MRGVPVPILVGSALTLAYTVAAFVLLSSSAGCDPVAAEFWTRTFACLEPNAIGDLLAGLFAPLAFLWFLVAVFLQSSELRLQREELKLTRAELADTRAVAGEQRDAMRAQAEEAKRSAENLTAQTEVMRNESAAQERQSTDRVVDEQLAALAALVSETINLPVKMRDGSITHRPLYTAAVASDIVTIRRLRSSTSAFELEMRERGYLADYSEIAHSIHSKLSAILSLEDQVSPAQAVRIRELALQEIAAFFFRFANVLSQYPKAENDQVASVR